MLNIEIVSGNPTDGSLELTVDGKRGNGNGRAKRNWQVHWKVLTGSNVLYIADIKMKTGNGAPPSTDIFSGDPPRKQDADGKYWKAKVNGNAPIDAEYNYDIFWVGSGPTPVVKYDPKISVRPTFNFLKLIIGFIVGLLSLEFLRRKITKR